MTNLETKIADAEARKEVVLDILATETHPGYIRTYKMELGRIKSRLRDYASAKKAAEFKERAAAGTTFARNA